MISGSDDRIAFVIQTEAQLDGIRAARGEVRGLGTDSAASAQRMASASQSQAQSIAAVAGMSDKSRAAFDAMTDAEKRATLTLMGVGAAEQKAALGAVQMSAAVTGAGVKSEAALGGMDAAAKKAAGGLAGAAAAEQKVALGAAELGAAITSNATAVNMQIGAFMKRGEIIDKTSVAALEAYRAEGDALSANLARLGATEQEINKIGAAIARAEQQGGAATAFGPQLGPQLPPGGLSAGGLQPGPIDNTDRALKKIPGSARTAANALALMSNAAFLGTGSTQGLLVAAGGLATGLAALSKSATIAASASGIGAIVTVGAVVVSAFQHMGDAAKATQAQIDHLNTFTAQTMPGQIAALKQARDTAIAAATATAAAATSDQGFFQRMLHKRQPGEGLGTDLADTFGLSSPQERAMQKIDDLYSRAIPKAAEIARAERLRLVALGEQVRDQAEGNRLQIIGAKAVEGSLDTFKRRRQEIVTQAALEDENIKREFRHRDEQGHLVALTKEQRAEMQKLIDQHRQLTDVQLHELTQAEQLANAAYKRATATAVAGAGSNVVDKYNARIAEINAEADADAQAGRDAVDVEAQKQAKIRALRRDTARAAMEDAKALTAVLIDSGSKQVRAVGHAAETIRRVVIGAQAAHAAVEAAIEGGKAIGSLAALDFRGAALHGAAALELAKAAALGAQESLGGGRSASAGGGAGGGGTGSTFEPRTGTEGQGSVVVNLYSENPYGPEQIQQVRYLLGRADVLKQPVAIQIAPTNGLRAA